MPWWCSSAVVGPCDVQAAAADFAEQVNEVGKTCPVRMIKRDGKKEHKSRTFLLVQRRVYV